VEQPLQLLALPGKKGGGKAEWAPAAHTPKEHAVADLNSEDPLLQFKIHLFFVEKLCRHFYQLRHHRQELAEEGL